MLEHLNDVQDIDLKLDALNEELKQVPPDLILIRQQKVDLDKALETRLGEQDGLRKDLNRNELELSSLESRRRQASEGALRAGSSKEASQFQNQELQFATRIQELEEDTLPLMESVEQVSEVIGSLEKELDELRPRLQSLAEAEQNRIDSLNQNLNSIGEMRNSLANAIEPKLLSQYDQIRRARRGLGLVTIQNNKTCGGCTMQLPIHIVQKARANKSITKCPSCGRILWNRDQG